MKERLADLAATKGKPAVIDVLQLAFLLFEFEIAIIQVVIDQPYI